MRPNDSRSLDAERRRTTFNLDADRLAMDQVRFEISCSEKKHLIPSPCLFLLLIQIKLSTRKKHHQERQRAADVIAGNEVILPIHFVELNAPVIDDESQCWTEIRRTFAIE